MINFAGTLDHHAAVRPEKTALAWRDGRRTYSELLRRAQTMAAALADHGVSKGDVVALLMQNRPEFIEMIYAINRLGAVFMPLNFRLAIPEWRYIIEHSQARAVVTEPEFHHDLAETIDGLNVDIVLTVGEPDDQLSARPDGILDLEAFIAPYSDTEMPVCDVARSDLQRLMYTSGTTSRPKGVRITHENFAWKNLGMLLQFGWNDTEVTVVGGPLYHVGALDMGGLTTLHAGGTLVLQRRFEAANLLSLIEEHRGTSVWLAPAMVNAILQSPGLRHHDLSSLNLILSGGEKMPESRLRQILDALPHVWFADAYGLTETVSSDTFMDRAHMVSKLGSVGLPLPHQQIRVVDADGKPVPPDTIGEITVRGPKVFDGYWRDEAATAAAIRDGWFHTGDMGRMDEDGYLYIEDRKKDMIVSGGENIASPEVERALFEHPAVLEAAVIGHPDPRWGEVPSAYVVLKPGEHASAEELVDFCRQRLAKFKVPKYVTFIEALPRTPSGKVLKRNLRVQIADEPADR
ncbi:long-chain fatty acid--CoA ligase [uncultured Aeromicrobium sp.]|uniref:acyl-CoA synthetase n=1 Tax=uncultured Aeromicrobium sp. TaxID=337820 RepID=UPI0025E51794|nr:long-chain fatty acid--CoA ligase [uncultured Aeromicrobium sp.]